MILGTLYGLSLLVFKMGGSTSEYLLPAVVSRLGGGHAQKHCRVVTTSGPAEFSLAWENDECPDLRLRALLSLGASVCLAFDSR